MTPPKAFTDDSDLGLCYEKKVIMNEHMFFLEPIGAKIQIITLLLQCLEDSNKINKHDFPFFQLRVRPSRFYEEYPGICFELRWGSKELLNGKKMTTKKDKKIAKEVKKHEEKGKKNIEKWVDTEKDLAKEDEKIIKRLKK